ncbi:MAG: hypothetical protein ACJAYU_003142 [Bradymonadia bacterium]|jgi:hypothetical protein
MDGLAAAAACVLPSLIVLWIGSVADVVASQQAAAAIADPLVPAEDHVYLWRGTYIYSVNVLAVVSLVGVWNAVIGSLTLGIGRAGTAEDPPSRHRVLAGVILPLSCFIAFMLLSLVMVGAPILLIGCLLSPLLAAGLSTGMPSRAWRDAAMGTLSLVFLAGLYGLHGGVWRSIVIGSTGASGLGGLSAAAEGVAMAARLAPSYGALGVGGLLLSLVLVTRQRRTEGRALVAGVCGAAVVSILVLVASTTGSPPLSDYALHVESGCNAAVSRCEEDESTAACSRKVTCLLSGALETASE